MTLIVGIVCKDAIVLGSDSQTTKDGMKRTDAQKIVTVNFGENKILVAQAGNAGTSARAIELLQDLAKDRPIDDYRLPADLARQSMLKVKEELRQQYGNCSIQEFQELIWKNDLQAELMLAYYFKGKPHIFKIDLLIGRADKETSWYSAIGCASNLGSFLMTEHCEPEMVSGIASTVVAYIIETVCKHDTFCSPPTKVGLIINDLAKYVLAYDPSASPHPTMFGSASAIIYTANTVEKYAKQVNAVLLKERKNRIKKFEKLLEKSKVENKKVIDGLRNPTPKSLKKVSESFKGLVSCNFFKSA